MLLLLSTALAADVLVAQSERLRARGQEALNQILDNLPSILFGAAKGKIAESVARAQNIMSEATARIEELRLKKDKQNHDREESLKRLDLEKEELETRLKIDRANALSDGITKIANGAAKLADAGLSKAHIKRVVEDALEKLHVTLDDANGLNPPNF